jgi:hypothetical protein
MEELIEERESAPETDSMEKITDYSIFGVDGLRGRIVLDGKIKGSLEITENLFVFTDDKPYRMVELCI